MEQLQMKSKFKRILILVLILAIIGSAVWWRTRQLPEEPTGGLTIYGNVDIRDARLTFKEQERVAGIWVQEGDRVTRGQLLAKLETERLAAQIQQAQAGVEAQRQVVQRLEQGTRKEEIEQARAQVEAARVRHRNAIQSLERLSQTAEKGITSQQDLDDARARVEVEKAQLRVSQQVLDLALAGPRSEEILEARARLKAAQAEQELLEIRYRDLSLYAPAPGVVISRILEPGEMAGPSQAVLTLALMDPKWVRAYIPEPDLGWIAPGTKAYVISDAFPDEVFSGWIGFISPVAEFTPRNVETTDLRTKLVYEVRVHVEDPGDRLRLGMPVTVRVEHDPTAGG
jgi:HlyD family secretion protein